MPSIDELSEYTKQYPTWNARSKSVDPNAAQLKKLKKPKISPMKINDASPYGYDSYGSLEHSVEKRSQGDRNSQNFTTNISNIKSIDRINLDQDS